MINEEKTAGSRTFDIINGLFFIVVSFLFLYPLYSILVDSFSTPNAAMQSGFKFYPSEFSVAAYKRVFASPPIWKGYLNTIFVTGASWLVGIVFNILGAYPLSRREFPHKTFWTLFVVFTMFFSGGLIPSYLLIRNLGWMNSYISIVVPGAISTWNLILARNFYMSMPSELYEAAKIDGASEVKLLQSIILPLSKPIIATISLFIIVANWNAWFNCLLYIQNTDKMVLQVLLKRIIAADSKEIITVSADAGGLSKDVSFDYVTVKAATIMVATLPILTIYPFIQKYFVKGIMVGSLKG